MKKIIVDGGVVYVSEEVKVNNTGEEIRFRPITPKDVKTISQLVDDRAHRCLEHFEDANRRGLIFRTDIVTTEHGQEIRNIGWNGEDGYCHFSIPAFNAMETLKEKLNAIAYECANIENIPLLDALVYTESTRLTPLEADQLLKATYGGINTNLFFALLEITEQVCRENIQV